jgi:hypothetical protein
MPHFQYILCSISFCNEITGGLIRLCVHAHMWEWDLMVPMWIKITIFDDKVRACWSRFQVFNIKLGVADENLQCTVYYGWISIK